MEVWHVNRFGYALPPIACLCGCGEITDYCIQGPQKHIIKCGCMSTVQLQLNVAPLFTYILSYTRMQLGPEC